MVRLVFRPYTQLRRSICTSESLRTSTRVSPGFVLARHRSPSFGSQRVRSGFVRPAKSRLRTPRECARFGLKKKDEIFPHRTPSSGLFHFHCASRVSIVTRRLAHMLDSLVRVSRRVGWDPTSTLRSGPQPLPRKGEAYRSRPGRTARKNPAPGEEREPESQHSTPGNRGSLITAHPVGRGVLLGPPLAAGGRRKTRPETSP